ncbi:dihydrofolate reductase family protein [Brevibacterium daeguense]|nr:dihydrofolate reductase family protein [Brevibacterium daeguense]
MRRLIYWVGMSIDGRIAGPRDEVDFFPQSEEYTRWMCEEYPETLPTHVRQHLGIDSSPSRHFDTVVMGWRTYEPALRIGITSPYSHLRQYVVSSRQQQRDPDVAVVSGDPAGLIRELKSEDSESDIYLAGGAALAGSLLPEIDGLIIKLYPVVAGTGHPLFRAAFSPTLFSLADVRKFEGGNAVLTYQRRQADAMQSTMPSAPPAERAQASAKTEKTERTGATPERSEDVT